MVKMQEIIRTENLNIGYDKPIVKDVNISASKGEIVVLIGPNGAGKTTLIKTICGLIPALSGDVYVGGKELKSIKHADRAKAIATVLTEKTYAEYSCAEMVAMGRYPYTNGIGTLSDEDIKIVNSAIELTEIGDIADKSFLKISDGQRQRVLLARAICQQPEILILDEPTSFLDVKYKIEYLKLLKSRAKEMNLCVIMSLHELDMAKQIADKIVCIKDDHIDKVGNAEEIFTDGYIKELFDITSGDFDEKNGLGILWPTN